LFIKEPILRPGYKKIIGPLTPQPERTSKKDKVKIVLKIFTAHIMGINTHNLNFIF
tara:strand:- start:734 stop:901 length:168 start_codon:yes stop_codon:yes gene_type:complete